MSAEKIKREILKRLTKNPEAIYEAACNIEVYSGYKCEEWPTNILPAPLDWNDEDDLVIEKAQRFTLEFLKKLPAHVFKNAEMYAHEAIDEEALDDTSDDTPSILFSDSKEVIIRKLRSKGLPGDLLKIGDYINSKLYSLKKAKLITNRGKDHFLDQLNKTDVDLLREAISSAVSYYFEGPEKLDECSTVLGLLLYISAHTDSEEIAARVARSLKRKKVKLDQPEPREFGDEYSDWMPVLFRAQKSIPYDILSEILEDIIQLDFDED